MRGWGDLGALGGMWGCWADVGDVVMGGKGAGMEGQGAAGGLLGGGTGPRAHSALCSPWFWGGAAPEGQQGPTSGQSPHFRPEPPLLVRAPHFWSEAPTSGPATQSQVQIPKFRPGSPTSGQTPPTSCHTPPPHCRSERPNFQSELPTSAPTSQLPLRTLEFQTELPTSGLKPPHFRSEFFISKVKLVFCSKPHFQPETPLPL